MGLCLVIGGLSSIWALEGDWWLTRTIVHGDGAENSFEGVAHFARSGARLIHDEDGLLEMVPGQVPLKATRRYVWSQEGGRIEVAFGDMRPFHTIATGVERPETTYLCAPDRYNVSYDFSAFPDWTSVWHVEGPKKDYVMTSRFTPSR